jgi:hypothetical protein
LFSACNRKTSQIRKMLMRMEIERTTMIFSLRLNFMVLAWIELMRIQFRAKEKARVSKTQSPSLGD